MKTKIALLFLLVFAAIGQTVFLHIDAKNSFTSELKATDANTQILDTELPSKVVVTISEENSNKQKQTDVESIIQKAEHRGIRTTKEYSPCAKKKKKEEKLLCKKAREKYLNSIKRQAEQEHHILGGNFTKNSSIN